MQIWGVSDKIKSQWIKGCFVPAPRICPRLSGTLEFPRKGICHRAERNEVAFQPHINILGEAVKEKEITVFIPRFLMDRTLGKAFHVG